MTEDLELLRRYSQEGLEEAFSALVQRYLNLVYSVAIRQLRSPGLAEEVAQSVFTELARNARKLKADTVLSAWLYQVARRTALNILRRETRRQSREQWAAEQNTMNAPTADWRQIEPLLDEAMDTLDGADRTAILLRYFENRSLREVGDSLGVTDDAAQKRVTRAVDRLRKFFSNHGMAVGTSGLVAALSANAVQAAPAGMAVIVSGAALTGAAAATQTGTLLALMATTKMKLAVLGSLALASAVTTVLIEQNSQAKIHQAQAAIQQQDTELAALQAERDRLAGLLPNRPTISPRDELQRLRGEIETLQEQRAQLVALQNEKNQLETALNNSVQASVGAAPPNRPTEKMIAMSLSCRDLALNARIYANAHQGQFPKTTAEAQSVAANPPSPTNLSVCVFELVYHGTEDALTNYAHPGEVLLIRPKTPPLEYPDGTLAQVYGFVDGHTTIIVARDGNFARWERLHTAPSEPLRK